MLAERVRLVLVGMATLGVVWAAGLVIGSFAGVRPVPMPFAAVVAFALVLPGFVAAVMTETGRGRKERRAGFRSFWQLLRRLPAVVLIVAAGLFLAFWLVGSNSINSLDGNPAVRDDGQYVLQNHGTEKVVDKATYDRAVDTEERIWASSAGFFGVAAAVLGAATVLRARVEE
jgi:hypothetical protein